MPLEFIPLGVILIVTVAVCSWLVYDLVRNTEFKDDQKESHVGAQHSLVVHRLWEAGVVGSNPTDPTINNTMDTLVLNADGLPISFLPPSTIQGKEAITYRWLDKVNVLEW